MRPADIYPSRWRLLTTIGLFLGVYGLGALTLVVAIAVNAVLISNGIISLWLLGVPILLLFAGVAAVTAVRVRLEPPSDGHRISAESDPDLLAVVESVASTMKTSVPDEIYIRSGVNASVAEDTRLLGLVSRKRVLTIGLGLINTLTIDELKAVLAHEFGHYAGSDTRLNSISYRGRETLIHALRNMPSGSLHSPLSAYLRFYLRRSAELSRQQEFAADAWSVQVAGTDGAASAFQKIHHESTLFAMLEADYLAPLAEVNVRPLNIYEWLRGLGTSAARNELADSATRRVARGLYDSHPTLTARLAAVAKLPHIESHTSHPARELMSDPLMAEHHLTVLHYPKNRAWETVPEEAAATHLMARIADRGKSYLADIDTAGSLTGWEANSSGFWLKRITQRFERESDPRRWGQLIRFGRLLAPASYTSRACPTTGMSVGMIQSWQPMSTSTR